MSDLSRRIFEVFPTLLGRFELNDQPVFNEIQQEIKDYIDNKVKFKYRDDWGKTHKISTSAINNEENWEVKDSIFNNAPKLANIITQEVKSYIQFVNPKCDISRLHCNESWLTQFNKDDFAHTHNHPSCDIAVVYYYQLPIEKSYKSGDFYIECPSLAKAGSFDSSHTNRIYVGQYAGYSAEPIKTGTLLIFPAYLPHGVTRVTEDNTRISLSCNFKLTPA